MTQAVNGSTALIFQSDCFKRFFHTQKSLLANARNSARAEKILLV